MGQAKQRGSYESRLSGLWQRFGVCPMTPERYNAYVAWTRSPIASLMGEEIEFFSSKDERLIGVILRDVSDRDFAYVTLGRDEKGRYRCIDVLASLTKTDARHKLFASIMRHADTGAAVFPQGDTHDDKAGIDLFASLVPEEKLNPYFRLIRDREAWLPARSVMREMMKHFIDVDGNFVEQFQTTGFDSRIWELYLYAALLELGLFVTKPTPAPDFKVEFGHRIVFIEAVTVGPTAGDPIILPNERPKERTLEEIRDLLKTKVPIKFGSALYSKLTRKTPYWEMQEVKGHPLVFAIADFHEAQSMTWTSQALLEYLYGVTHDFHLDGHGQLIISPLKIETYEFDGKKRPSGFFLQTNSENVSAILFSSSGTISKFNRMGKLAGFGLENHVMHRYGLRHKHDPNAFAPEPFFFEIRQGIAKETWAEGLSMFHNPWASHPVDPEMFPGIAHHFFKGGQIESFLPDFHVYSSFTWSLMIHGDEKDSVE